MATVSARLGSSCPACGLVDTSAATSGPTICANCGHRDAAAWTGRGASSRG